MPSSSNDDLFRYDSTLKGRKIRVMYLECHKGLNFHTSPIRVRLVEESLDTAEFDALSYVWGDQRTRVQIQCNGQRITVGRSLHAALMEYRYRLRRGRGRDGDRVRALWADAICINQSDEIEKTEQVRMMRDIYKAAIFTIIWLGPLEDGDVQAIQLAQLAYNRCPEHLRHEMKGTRRDYREFKSLRRGLPAPFEGEAFGDQVFDPTWKRLFEILHHPWFSRIWIVQELLVSEYAEIWRGRKSIEVDILLWMAHQIDIHTDLNVARQLQYPDEGFFAAKIAQCYYNFNENRPQPLWDNVMTTAGMEATEVLDRFFALAGISGEVPDNFINYSRRKEVVVSQVGLMLLLGSPKFPMTDCLDLLADRPSQNLRNRGLQVPTWIPDFLSGPPPNLHVSFLYQTSKFRSKHADFPLPELQIVTDPDTPNNSPRPLTVSEFPYDYAKAPELLAKAAVFDRIKAIVPAVKFPGRSNDTERITDDMERHHRYSINISRFITTVRLLSDSSLSLGDDVMSGDKFQEFWRTLVYNRAGDYFAEEIRPDNSVGVAFAYWYMFWKLFLTRKWEVDTRMFHLHLDVLQGLMDPFASIFITTYGYRSFFVTDSGRIGWAPPTAGPGDSIAMFRGNRIPFVAKAVGDSGAWEYIGGCYVHGCMDGEASQLDGAEWRFMRFL